MAASVKALRVEFGKMLKHTTPNADERIRAIRKALVAFERGEINRDSCLADCNQALGGYGVETLRLKGERRIADYVNMGDAFAVTILFSYRTARFYIVSWGEYIHTPD